MSITYEVLADFAVTDDHSNQSYQTEFTIRTGESDRMWIEQEGVFKYEPASQVYLDEAGIRTLAEVTARLVAIMDGRVH